MASGHGTAGFPSCRTPRLLLRPLAPEDRAEFVRVHEVSREQWGRWSPALPEGQTFETLFDDSLRRWTAGEAAGTECRRVGVLDDGRIAGFFSLSQIFRGPFQNAYAGWRVSTDCAGRGLCTEAMAAMLGLAFAPPPRGLGLHRVQANIIPSNAPSLRVAEKLGMRREGLALRYLQIAGRWQDHAMFAKLADEHPLADQP